MKDTRWAYERMADAEKRRHKAVRRLAERIAAFVLGLGVGCAGIYVGVAFIFPGVHEAMQMASDTVYDTHTDTHSDGYAIQEKGETREERGETEEECWGGDTVVGGTMNTASDPRLWVDCDTVAVLASRTLRTADTVLWYDSLAHYNPPKGATHFRITVNPHGDGHGRIGKIIWYK